MLAVNLESLRAPACLSFSLYFTALFTSGVLKILLNLERRGNLRIHQPCLLPRKSASPGQRELEPAEVRGGSGFRGALQTSPSSGSVGAK